MVELSQLQVARIASVPVRSERNSGREGPRVLVFCIWHERKIGRVQKVGRKGVVEGKEGNACPQTPRF